jgi:hypothetical protein
MMKVRVDIPSHAVLMCLLFLLGSDLARLMPSPVLTPIVDKRLDLQYDEPSSQTADNIY